MPAGDDRGDDGVQALPLAQQPGLEQQQSGERLADVAEAYEGEADVTHRPAPARL
jgi:hypothetical protein